jgi:hypothetical protein
MKQQTNNSLNQILEESNETMAFLEEGLNYVNICTPTDINSGGCGVFAQLLYNKFQELGVKVEIIALFSNLSVPCYKAFKNYVSTGEFNDKVMVEHIVIRFGELYLDSQGIFNPKLQLMQDITPISIEQLNFLVENAKWNTIFDRDCIPFIKEKINEVFEHENDFHSGIFKYPKQVRYTDKTIREKKAYSSLNNLISLLS